MNREKLDEVIFDKIMENNKIIENFKGSNDFEELMESLKLRYFNRGVQWVVDLRDECDKNDDNQQLRVIGKTMSKKESEYQLCFVDDLKLFFHKLPVAKVTGDDWNDAPYDCNAGIPYYENKKDIFTINLKMFYKDKNRNEFVFNEPKHIFYELTDAPNHYLSVDDINKDKKAPWITIMKNGNVIDEIYAGTELGDFLDKLQKLGIVGRKKIAI